MAATEYVPVEAGAVYNPVLLIVPPPAPLIVQSTWVLLSPTTIALKVRLPPGKIAIALGAIEKETLGSVTSAVADLPGTALLVAVTKNDCPSRPAGAV